MRLTALMMIVFVVHVSATGTAQNVTLTADHTSLEKVIEMVKTQTGYYFFYNQRQLKNAKPVTIKADHVPLSSFLEQVFKDQPLTYLIQNQTIFIRTKPKAVTAATDEPPVTIQGEVRNSAGDYLQGASVYLIPGNMVIQTDKSGAFSFPSVAPGKYTLQISYVGYETIRMPIIIGPDPKPVYHILLPPSADKLEEVVVVNNGYQVLSRERSAGSVSKANMTVVQNRSISMNLMQRLDGLVPGLVINNAPGNNTVNLIVRGLSTIRANTSLLYVVDGVVVANIDDVNPNDVQDVTLLKDATAASIWGSRASNGVIVITTKKGYKNSSIKVEYNGFINIQGKPDIEYLPYMRSSQFISTMKDIIVNDTNYSKANLWSTMNTTINGNAAIAPHETIMYNYLRGLITETTRDAELDSLAGLDNLQQIKDRWYRSASLMNHTIAIRGGSNNYAIYGSLAYTNNVSSTPGEKNQTYKMNVRQDFNLNKNIAAYVVTNLSENQTAAANPPTLGVTNRFLPYQMFTDASGNGISMPWLYRSDSLRAVYESKSGVNLNYNPVDEMNYASTKGNAFKAYVTGGITARLWKGLKFEGVYGLMTGNSKTTLYQSPQSFFVRNQLAAFTVPASGGAPRYFLPATGGQLTVTGQNMHSFSVRNQLTYDFSSKNDLHQLTLLAGHEATESFTNNSSAVTRGYDPQLQTSQPVNFDTLSKGITGTVFPNLITKSVLGYDGYAETETEFRTLSWYGNAAYTFMKKYTINGSFRNDQSNLFGKDRSAQNKPVWSAGLAWQIYREPFMQSFTWLSFLSLRATYGLSGNQPLISATSVDILSGNTNNFASTGTSLTISTFGNKKLSWESTKTTNIGFDFAVLKGRLSGSGDVYFRRTSNLIYNMPTNAFTGTPASVIGNMGNISNNGIEGRITSINISTKKFSWSTTLVASYNVNKVTKLYVSTPITSALILSSTPYVEGYPAFAQFGYRYKGLDAMGDPMIQFADGKISKAPGATPGDMVYLGTFQPKLTGGFSNSFHYQNFRLSINAVYSFGSTLRRDVVGTNAAMGILSGRTSPSPGYFFGNVYTDFDNRWKNPGDEARTNIPSYVPSSSASNTRRYLYYYTNGDINYFNGAYIKIRDINLSYSIPVTVIKHIKADEITFRVTMSNVLVWTANHYGIDPEFHDSFSSLRTMPTAQHSITFGANVRF